MLQLSCRRITLGAMLMACVSTTVYSTPLNNVTDTEIIHTIYGTDKFYTKKDKKTINFHMSPYYQHAGRGRNASGDACPLGERLGKWNMSGIFFGTDAANKDWNDKNYPALFNAYNSAKSLFTASNTQAAVSGNTNPLFQTDLTDEKSFDPKSCGPTNDALSFLSEVRVTHEKLGLRGQVTFDLPLGLGFTVKSGITDYKEKPHFPGLWNSTTGNALTAAANGSTSLTAGPVFIAKTDKADAIYNLNPNPSPTSDPTDPANQPISPIKATTPESGGQLQQAAANTLYYLFTTEGQRQIFYEIGLNTCTMHDTCAEDTHVQLFWQYPWQMKERGEVSVTTIPYVSIGAWLPTGKIRDQNKAFSIDTGNGGFYGLTFEGSIAFDFPKIIQTSFGGGALVSFEKDLVNYRVPSANGKNPIKQSGFYPWRTSVANRPGTTWYANASFKADGFSDALSLYCDYLYTYHQTDSFSLKEMNDTRAAAFKPGLHHLKKTSSWKSQLVNVGLGYKVNNNLAFGGALQSMIGGVRVFKTTTIMGSVTFTW